MIDMKRVLVVLVMLQAAVIGLLVAGRYRITLTPVALPEPAARKRAVAKRVLRNGAKLPKTPPRES